MFVDEQLANRGSGGDGVVSVVTTAEEHGAISPDLSLAEEAQGADGGGGGGGWDIEPEASLEGSFPAATQPDVGLVLPSGSHEPNAYGEPSFFEGFRSPGGSSENAGIDGPSSPQAEDRRKSLVPAGGQPGSAAGGHPGSAADSSHEEAAVPEASRTALDGGHDAMSSWVMETPPPLPDTGDAPSRWPVAHALVFAGEDPDTRLDDGSSFFDSTPQLSPRRDPPPATAPLEDPSADAGLVAGPSPPASPAAEKSPPKASPAKSDEGWHWGVVAAASPAKSDEGWHWGVVESSSGPVAHVSECKEEGPSGSGSEPSGSGPRSRRALDVDAEVRREAAEAAETRAMDQAVQVASYLNQVGARVCSDPCLGASEALPVRRPPAPLRS